MPAGFAAKWLVSTHQTACGRPAIIVAATSFAVLAGDGDGHGAPSTDGVVEAVMPALRMPTRQ